MFYLDTSHGGNTDFSAGTSVFLHVNYGESMTSIFFRWDYFPGPKAWQSLPFIGHTYMLRDGPVEALLDMKKKYGNVFRLDLGSTPNIIIAGYDEINQAYKMEV